MKADIQQTEIEFKISGDSPEIGAFEKGKFRHINSKIAETLIKRGLANIPEPKTKGKK